MEKKTSHRILWRAMADWPGLLGSLDGTLRGEGWLRHGLDYMSEKEKARNQPKKLILKRVTRTVRFWTSLVIQWQRICLSMQGTQVGSPVHEDYTRSRANSVCAPLPLTPVGLEPVLRSTEKPPQSAAHAPPWRAAPARCNERKPTHSNRDPGWPKIQQIKLSFFSSD